MARYEVTGPMALVKDRAGKVRYYYTGASLPDDIPAEELERLAGRGLISKVAEPAVAAAPADDSKGDPAESGSVERPSQVAVKLLWVDYAVSRGMVREQAEGMTKQELIDAYPAE